MSNKADDKSHFDECHARWIKRKHAKEWVEGQCMTCVFYLLLPGQFASDWGVCSNVKSPMDGKVAFEHDGCDNFVMDEDY